MRYFKPQIYCLTITWEGVEDKNKKIKDYLKKFLKENQAKSPVQSQSWREEMN